MDDLKSQTLGSVFAWTDRWVKGPFIELVTWLGIKLVRLGFALGLVFKRLGLALSQGWRSIKRLLGHPSKTPPPEDLQESPPGDKLSPWGQWEKDQSKKARLREKAAQEKERTETRIQGKSDHAKKFSLQSGLMRLSFTAASLWKRIPFSALFSLSVLIPATFNIADKFVMNRVRFGRYLSNHIRLAYEDFYYTLRTAQENDVYMSKKDVRYAARYLLGVINRRYDNAPNLQFNVYSDESRIIIMRFIFMLRCFALTTIAFGQLPKYLPTPEAIDAIAVSIQNFMEKNAWISFLSPKKMKEIELLVPRAYVTTLENLLKDKQLSSLFLKDCDARCSADLLRLVRKRSL